MGKRMTISIWDHEISIFRKNLPFYVDPAETAMTITNSNGELRCWTKRKD